jgi:signal transduction histidine kinase
MTAICDHEHHAFRRRGDAMIRRFRAAYAGRPRPAALQDVPGFAVTDRALEALALILMVVSAMSSIDDTNTGLLALLVAAGWAPLLLRHRWPVRALVAVVAVEGVHLFAVDLVAPVEFNSIPIATMVACYSLAMQRDRWTAWVSGGVAALVLLGLGTIARPGDQLAANMFALDLVLAATAIGVLIRGRYLRLAAMERRAVQAEEAAEEEARRQVADERLRMARELHDVIAHNLALVNAQSGVAEYLIHTDPEAAAKALKNLTEHTRQALDELRATVGLLRQDTESGEEARRVPMPGLVDLPTLIESHRSSGVDVTLTVIGDPKTLPALTDLAAYRIAQEAMTNARKHAPESVVEVTLAWAPDELRLKVDNTASPVAAPDHRGEGTGHGILGMHERALAAHGTLTAEPRSGGGFRVLAQLPINPQESS